MEQSPAITVPDWQNLGTGLVQVKKEEFKNLDHEKTPEQQKDESGNLKLMLVVTTLTVIGILVHWLIGTVKSFKLDFAGGNDWWYSIIGNIDKIPDQVQSYTALTNTLIFVPIQLILSIVTLYVGYVNIKLIRTQIIDIKKESEKSRKDIAIDKAGTYFKNIFEQLVESDRKFEEKNPDVEKPIRVMESRINNHIDNMRVILNCDDYDEFLAKYEIQLDYFGKVEKISALYLVDYYQCIFSYDLKESLNSIQLLYRANRKINEILNEKLLNDQELYKVLSESAFNPFDDERYVLFRIFKWGNHNDSNENIRLAQFMFNCCEIYRRTIFSAEYGDIFHDFFEVYHKSNYQVLITNNSELISVEVESDRVIVSVHSQKIIFQVKHLTHSTEPNDEKIQAAINCGKYFNNVIYL